MEEWAIKVLECIKCGGDLNESHENLTCQKCGKKYPIVDNIPRFVELENYADSFGFQWNLFNKTQHDKYNKYNHSKKRFETETSWENTDLENNIVLDAGCGSGRFTEIALSKGAKVIALDLSNAVESCYNNMIELGYDESSFIVVQASFYNMPIKSGALDKAFSLGVLQHTPDPSKSLKSICRLVRRKGEVAFWVYEKSWRMWIGYLYYFRFFTKHVSQKNNWRISKLLIAIFFPISWVLDKFIPVVGKKIIRLLIPIAYRKVSHDMTYSDSRQWSLLDKFDNISPAYDSPILESEMFLWLSEAGFVKIKRNSTPGLAVKALKK